MDLTTYKSTFDKSDTPGWTAIDNALKDVYKKPEPDFHLAPSVPFFLGGQDPIDGVSVYKRSEPSPHLHYVSYGMSELYYNEEAAGRDVSGWGFEFSFRLSLPQDVLSNSCAELPAWPIDLMQNLARYVIKSGKWFESGHRIPANGPIAGGTDTALVGLVFLNDPELASIETPHGTVEFLQLVGLTERELLALSNKQISVDDLSAALEERNELFVTRLERAESVC